MANPYLHINDKAILQSKEWLTCRIIDTGQQLLKRSLTQHLSGYQSTQYGKRYRFVQVSNRGSHWITVSNNINCGDNVVDVYDSAYAYIEADTKAQVCSLMRPACDSLEIRMPNVQRQPNSYDCGLFAIAIATELTFGRDPLLCYWDTKLMRSHFVKCLEQGKMEYFPQKTHRRVPIGNRYKKSLSFKVYCKCRMPNDPSKAMIK